MTSHFDTGLSAALERLGRCAPTPDLNAARISRAVRRRRMMIAGPIAAALAVVAVLAGVILAQPRGASTAGPGASVCLPLQTGPLPQWARAGFSGDSFPPFAYSASGDVVAIVFGDPLAAPPSPDHNNKILWVVRGSNTDNFGTVSDFSVTAQLEGTDRDLDMRIPMGPSIVDMPTAGCWQLDLRWGDHSDTINLRWRNP